jgi:iron-sulfur cluster repair protein YtfE (RIC family)
MPSIAEPRRTIIAQHETLRQMVRDMMVTASRIANGEVAERGTLRVQIAMLRWALELHLLDEEHLLEPVLARLNGSGTERLAAMNEEHARQRAVIASFESGLGGNVGARALAAMPRLSDRG